MSLQAAETRHLLSNLRLLVKFNVTWLCFVDRDTVFKTLLNTFACVFKKSRRYFLFSYFDQSETRYLTQIFLVGQHDWPPCRSYFEPCASAMLKNFKMCIYLCSDTQTLWIAIILRQQIFHVTLVIIKLNCLEKKKLEDLIIFFL